MGRSIFVCLVFSVAWFCAYWFLKSDFFLFMSGSFFGLLVSSLIIRWTDK